MDFAKHFRIAYLLEPMTEANARLSRAEFMPLAGLAAGALSAAMASYVFLPAMAAMAAVLACVHLLVVPAVIAAARRLHDTGRSGFCLALPLHAMGLSAILILANDRRFTAGFVDDRVAYAAAVAVTLCAVTLTVRRLLAAGDPGPNRYGPAPSGAQGAVGVP